MQTDKMKFTNKTGPKVMMDDNVLVDYCGCKNPIKQSTSKVCSVCNLPVYKTRKKKKNVH